MTFPLTNQQVKVFTYPEKSMYYSRAQHGSQRMKSIKFGGPLTFECVSITSGWLVMKSGTHIYVPRRMNQTTLVIPSLFVKILIMRKWMRGIRIKVK